MSSILQKVDPTVLPNPCKVRECGQVSYTCSSQLYKFPLSLFNLWEHAPTMLPPSEVLLVLRRTGFLLGIHNPVPPHTDTKSFTPSSINYWVYPMCPSTGVLPTQEQIERYQMIRDACSDGEDMETGSILLQNFK